MRKVAQKGVEQTAVPRVLCGDLDPRIDPPHPQVPLLDSLIAERKDIHLMRPPVEPGQLSGKVLHVDARAAVDVGGVLVGEEGDAHRRSSVLGESQITVPSAISAFFRMTMMPSRM